jgi:Right handed beta helix region
MRMNFRTLTFALLTTTTIAARGGEASAAEAKDALNARGCYDPADFGAVPNDGIDDRVPAQQALDAASATGGRVCFGHGRWRLSRSPAGTYNRFAALSTHGAHVEIQGVGPGTVLEVVGDQGGATTWVISVDPGARDIAIRDLTIDTSGATNTDEQFHAIEIGNGVGTGPVEDVRVENVHFEHPSTGDGTRKGDCLRLVGNTPESAVRRVTVIGGTFTRCARSGIAIQRNVFDLIIQGNQFTQASDQDIDSEPTGGVNDLNGSVSIIGNVFRDDVSVAQGDFAVTIGGIGGPMARVVVSGNIFEGRGINFYRASDVALTGNTFVATMESEYGVINSGNVLERVSITGNTIRRSGVAGAAIRLLHQSGKSPGRLVISDNVITQETPSSGILLESAQHLTVSNNDLTWTVPAPTALGIYLRSTIRPADGILISGNRINAQGLLAAVFLGASPQTFRAVSVIGNMARGATASLRCENAGLFEQPIVHAANNWETTPTCSVPLVASRP